MRDHALEVAALLDELEAVDGADPLDAVAVVAAEEDAEVDELVVGEEMARQLSAAVDDELVVVASGAEAVSNALVLSAATNQMTTRSTASLPTSGQLCAQAQTSDFLTAPYGKFSTGRLR